MKKREAGILFICVIFIAGVSLAHAPEEHSDEPAENHYENETANDDGFTALSSGYPSWLTFFTIIEVIFGVGLLGVSVWYYRKRSS